MMYTYGGGGLWSWIGIISGIAVLIGAIVVYSRPALAQRWGYVILVVSCVDLLAGSGGFFAAILGVIGGILAITWEPRR
jgi:hypothetical protein